MKRVALFIFVLTFCLLLCACEEDTNTKICDICNKMIDNDARFCPNCGTSIAGSMDEQETNSTNAPTNQATRVEYTFIDYKEFSQFWFNGTFRCGTDFGEGEYYILPLFGAGAMYEVSDKPDDWSWSEKRLMRKINVQKGDYVRLGLGAIMVCADDIDTSNWAKYGIFQVGVDILAGEYKIEGITDIYKTDLYNVQGIHGGYQINNSVDGEPLSCRVLFDKQQYITLEDGQYIVITNARLTNVDVTNHVDYNMSGQENTSPVPQETEAAKLNIPPDKALLYANVLNTINSLKQIHLQPDTIKLLGAVVMNPKSNNPRTIVYISYLGSDNKTYTDYFWKDLNEPEIKARFAKDCYGGNGGRNPIEQLDLEEITYYEASGEYVPKLSPTSKIDIDT